MEKNRVIKLVAIVSLVVAIVSMGVAFAALSTTLNIAGQSKVKAPDWLIKFQNIGEAIQTGNGVAEDTPILSDTSISNVKAAFDGDGTVSYEFDVYNDGIIDAKIGTLASPDKPTCSGNHASDEALVCEAITTTLTYKTDGTTVATDDTLSAGETKRMVYTINYENGTNYPEDVVNVTGLDITIIYIEN